MEHAQHAATRDWASDLRGPGANITSEFSRVPEVAWRDCIRYGALLDLPNVASVLEVDNLILHPCYAPEAPSNCCMRPDGLGYGLFGFLAWHGSYPVLRYQGTEPNDKRYQKAHG